MTWGQFHNKFIKIPNRAITIQFHIFFYALQTQKKKQNIKVILVLSDIYNNIYYIQRVPT